MSDTKSVWKKKLSEVFKHPRYLQYSINFKVDQKLGVSFVESTLFKTLLEIHVRIFLIEFVLFSHQCICKTLRVQ